MPSAESDVELIGSAVLLPNGRQICNRLVKVSRPTVHAFETNAQSAMEEGISHTGGTPGARHRQLYKTWGEGGWGVIITGIVFWSTHDIFIGEIDIRQRAGRPATLGHAARSIRARPLGDHNRAIPPPPRVHRRRCELCRTGSTSDHCPTLASGLAIISLGLARPYAVVTGPCPHCSPAGPGHDIPRPATGAPYLACEVAPLGRKGVDRNCRPIRSGCVGHAAGRLGRCPNSLGSWIPARGVSQPTCEFPVVRAVSQSFGKADRRRIRRRRLCRAFPRKSRCAYTFFT